MRAEASESGIAAVGQPWRTASDQALEFVSAVLIAAGCDPEPARSVAAALTEASLRGVDSHGLRLILHYVKVVRTGRVNPKPRLSFARSGPGTGTVDADNGFGHYASFFAIDHALDPARDAGVAAVSVINSSHFGAAGCYVLRAANEGYVAFGMCNSDSFVLPHDGVRPFHGTNPIAFAAPVAGERPYLVDMATSIVPWNRVQDHIMEEQPLPEEVAVDDAGRPTTDPGRSAALLPLGGILYGYKGAALAGIAEVLSAIMSGMPHCSRLLGMAGPDFSTPRRLGHFFLVIDPRRFISMERYYAGMAAYLEDLRNQAGRNGANLMAPGDREWSIEDERRRQGIPISDRFKIELDNLAASLAVERLRTRASS